MFRRPITSTLTGSAAAASVSASCSGIQYAKAASTAAFVGVAVGPSNRREGRRGPRPGDRPAASRRPAPARDRTIWRSPCGKSAASNARCSCSDWTTDPEMHGRAKVGLFASAACVSELFTTCTRMHFTTDVPRKAGQPPGCGCLWSMFRDSIGTSPIL